MKKYWKIFLVVFLCLGAVLAWSRLRDHDAQTTEALPTPAPLVAIKDWGRLTTIEMDLSTVVKVVNPRRHRGNEVLIYGVCGQVTAGIDLNKLTDSDIRVDGQTIYVQLPPAEIFTLDPLLENDVEYVPPYKVGARSVEIESPCEKIYSWSVPELLDPTPELIADAKEQALIAFHTAAQDSGILLMAQDNAQKELKKFLELIGYQQVIFQLPIEHEQETP